MSNNFFFLEQFVEIVIGLNIFMLKYTAWLGQNKKAMENHQKTYPDSKSDILISETLDVESHSWYCADSLI